jgi:catechol 2,3-dioxygenase-like lactoylglutathione lyase family enzyme
MDARVKGCLVLRHRGSWSSAGVGRPADGGTYRHYDVGLEHLAFQVDTRDEVDEAYQRCVSAGGKIESPPEEHYVDQGEDYYAFFAFDPDGIRIEIVCDRLHG